MARHKTAYDFIIWFEVMAVLTGTLGALPRGSPLP